MKRVLFAATLLLPAPVLADVMPAPAPKLANADDVDEGYARIPMGKESDLKLSVDTAPGKAITWRAVSLPRGMTLTAEPYPSPRAALRWTPTEDELGESDAIVEATDGHDTVRKTMHYNVHDNWATGLLPSAGTSIHLPRAGTMVGVPLNLALVAWANRNINAGSSHGRFYVQVEPLRALYGEERMGAGIGFGFDASFERMPKRRWLIPYYGLTFGALLHRQLPDGGVGYALPQLGAYLWADHGVFVHASAGWMLPFSSFADQTGLRGALGVTFAWW